MAKRGRLEIKPAPYTPPRQGEIVVSNRAVAINPIDWLTQSMGDIFFPWLKYPFILGSDVAGEAVEVGAGVSRFKVGDRVLGHAVGVDKRRNNPAEGAFQAYTVLLSHMAAPIPDAMPYEKAAVLPLTLSTAACGLFERDQLALHHPSAHPEPTGRTLLVRGGSTSVGSNAIQLAVAAGYEVITTASPKNFGYVRKLGAAEVFDYRSQTVVKDVIKAFDGRTIAGTLAIRLGSAKTCLDTIQACKGDPCVQRRQGRLHGHASGVVRRCARRRPQDVVAGADNGTPDLGERLDDDQGAAQGRPHQIHLRHFPHGQRSRPDDLLGLPARRTRGRPSCRRTRSLGDRTRARPGASGDDSPEGRRLGQEGRGVAMTALVEQAASVPPITGETKSKLSGGAWLAGGLLGVSVALVSYRYVAQVGPVSPTVAKNRVFQPWIIVHAAGAATALLLGPFQFRPALRRRWPVIHRWTGRAYVVGCLVGGVAAFALPSCAVAPALADEAAVQATYAGYARGLNLLSLDAVLAIHAADCRLQVSYQRPSL